MQGAFLVTAISDKSQYVFMAKVKSGKSKVKKADSVISLSEKNHEIYHSTILNDQTVKIFYGNMFQLLQREVNLFEDTKIISNIELSGIVDKTHAKKKAGTNQEDYAVTGVEDTRQLQHFSLFNIDELKLPQQDSRKTSSSTHKDIQGGSLATILQQALISEDKDQLDWLLSQRDLAVIDKTLLQLKDPKTISNLFRQILLKY